MAKKRVDKRGTRKPITKIKFLVEGISFEKLKRVADEKNLLG